ncbi:MAG: tRNA uridine-5-carboxymethylaminomethyl(34) synthesis GTPase MnmE [Candidatus Sericytochromatia bacterium]|nr:tRNA uridine-5-carboxymethylaminomethyl(34) synthesis GTPase MnmE [Candidatus Tanganyikabacteria bacterium]
MAAVSADASTSDTIAAIATPPGAGGIGIVRVSGPDAFAIARAIFRVQGAPPLISGRGLHVGKVVDSAGATVDSAVLLIFPGPHSYTTEDVAEIQGHGGQAACGRVLGLALRQGARLAAAGEFTRRAFLGGRLDLAQAEAVADLIAARGERALELAVSQLEGRLSRAVSRARQACLELLARIEAVLDFPEDVPSPGPEEVQAILGDVREQVERLLATAEAGRLARSGARVAIVGRPNVGKSSLLNALVQADRAIVTATPGTTRDVVETSFVLGGIPLTLLDTAGIRDAAADEVEALGMERSRRQLAEADLRLLVADAASGAGEGDLALVAACSGRPTVYVGNKADLLSGAADLPPGQDWVLVSALTGAGLDELDRTLLGVLAGKAGSQAPGDVAINARHRAVLEEAASALARAQEAARSDLPLDCVAADVGAAVRGLGQVVGADLAEEMLDVLFSRFCVGK